MMYISSTSNTLVKNVVAMHTKKGRRLASKFIIEGQHLIEEALQSNAKIDKLFVIESEVNNFSIEDDKVVYVSPAVMKKLATTSSAPKYLATVTISEGSINFTENIIYLDYIADPGNLGTIIRSALAFGIDSIIMSEQCCDLYDPKVVRSTQGAIFRSKFRTVTNDKFIELCKENNYHILTSSLQASTTLQNIVVPRKWALVIGNESRGVSKVIRDQSDIQFIIPMQGVESLNAAVASGIMLFQLTK